MVDTASTSNVRALTDGSIWGGLFRQAMPIMCSSVLQSLGASVNSIWIGRYLGENALAAAANAHLVMSFLTSAALGIALAATILTGHCFGAGNLLAAKRVVGTSATFFVIISIALTICGLALSEQLLIFMRTPFESLALGVGYIRVVFLALPAMYAFAFVYSLLQGVGDSKIALYFMVLSVSIDAFLNPVLIFGHGSLPAAGIVGSAVALLIAYTVGLTSLVAYLYHRRHPLCLRGGELSLLRLDFSILGRVVRKGLPMGAEMLVVSMSGVLMIVLVNRFGVDTVAAYGASLQVWTYIQMPAICMSMAVATMAALNIGRQKWERIGPITYIGVVYCALFTGAMVGAVYALDLRLFAVFLPAGSPALQIASHINGIVAWSFIMLGVSMVLFGVMRATGAVVTPLVVFTLTLLVVRFPLADLLLDRWQADAIWWSFPISLALTLILASIQYRDVLKKSVLERGLRHQSRDGWD